MTVKRREAKSKEEKERYSHLNADFQRIARRDRKPSSVINASNAKEVEEKNRMGKTRDFFKKTKATLEIPREHVMQRWAQ